jgi:hypothetical protein
VSDVLAPEARIAPSPPSEPTPGPPRARPRWPGILSFGLALLTLAGLVTGLTLVTADEFVAATYAAWIASGVGVLAVLVALVAVIGRFGRGWAAAALVVAVAANPPVLTWALDTIGGLWA